jgi:hypothetical protein
MEKNGNPPSASRRAPQAVLFGNVDGPEITTDLQHLQARRIESRWQLSKPVAFAVASLACGEARR